MRNAKLILRSIYDTFTLKQKRRGHAPSLRLDIIICRDCTDNYTLRIMHYELIKTPMRSGSGF